MTGLLLERMDAVDSGRLLPTSGGFHDSFPRISSRHSVHQKESFVRSFVHSVVFPVAVNHSVSRSDSLPPSAPRSHSRIANASRVVQTHFLPPPLVLVRESRMPAESVRLTSALRPSFSFANRECQPSRSDSLPPSFTTFKRITKSRFTIVQWCKWLSININ